MLEIKNLKASINNKDILKGFNLKILPGEVHAIMGPNGSGKSTLLRIMAGVDKEIPIDERAQKGIFLAFQYPTEIPGVNTSNFLRTSLNKVRKAQGKKELDALSFLKIVKEKSNELGMDEK